MRIAFLLALTLGLGAISFAEADCPNQRAMLTTTTAWGDALVCANQACPQDYWKLYDYWCEGGAPNKKCETWTMLWTEVRTSVCNGGGSCTVTIEQTYTPFGKKTFAC